MLQNQALQTRRVVKKVISNKARKKCLGEANSCTSHDHACKEHLETVIIIIKVT